MKTEKSIRYIVRLLCLFAFLVAGWGTASAQEEMFQDRKFHVKVYTREGNEEGRMVRWLSFQKYDNAKSRLNALQAKKKANPTFFDINDALKELGLEMRNSRNNGEFTITSAIDRSGVLIVYDEYFVAVEILPGKNDYTLTLGNKPANSKPKSKLSETQKIDEVIVQGNSSADRDTTSTTAIETPDKLILNMKVHLRKGQTNEHSRLIIQPVALECGTEDTVAYLEPHICEGEEFRKLQNRRMDFDMLGKDPIGVLDTFKLTKDSAFSHEFQAIYMKEDKKKEYKGAVRVLVHDYHNVIYDNHWGGLGSCLKKKPYKLLSFSDAGAPLDIDEFAQVAEAKTRREKQNLSLIFEVGKDDVLTSDSINTVELKRLNDKLNQLGDKILFVTITATASPEGSMKRNVELAKGRANYARSFVRGRVSSDRIRTNEPKVLTWKDVLDSVKTRNDQALYESVSNIVNNNSEEAVFGLIKNQPYYETQIVPILERQRSMSFYYLVEETRVMNTGEVLEYYSQNKAKLLAGADELSDGDYYNLFKAIDARDSLEADTVTEIAYRHIVSQPDYVNLPFAPYVANRMALLNIRRGTPDLSVLAPFLDYSKPNNFKKPIGDMNNYVTITINREEHLVNQAIAYFQDGNFDMAHSLLFGGGKKTTIDPAKTERIRNYITFYTNFPLYVANQPMDEATKRDTRKALNYVLNADPESRAILFTEYHEELKKDEATCRYLIDQLSDDNPKKWYLMGINASRNPETETTVVAQGEKFVELTQEEMDRLRQENPDSLQRYEERKALEAISDNGAKKLPNYLAYFQHSFDLAPSYKRFYIFEGHVNEDLRKKYPYKKEQIPTYRRMFNELMAERNAQRQAAEASEAAQTDGETQQEGGEATPAEPAAPAQQD